MDPTKKRKTDDNGDHYPIAGDSSPPSLQLSPEDVRKILEPFTKQQLIEIVESAVFRDPDTLAAVRNVADQDPALRKLFIRGIGWETTSEKLQGVFSSFGEVAEAIAIMDKNTGKAKGYGFVTFKHIDGAVSALKEPNKKIDGRMTVTQLAAAGNTTGGVDLSMRKIYVGNVPFEISAERLLDYFSTFGEIEEGPLGFDKQTGKVKGFAFFVYKTEEGAKASVVDPIKMIDGHQVSCKFATDGKKVRPGGFGNQNAGAFGGGDGGPQGGMMNAGYGGYPPVGMSSYGGGVPPVPPLHQNPHMGSGVGVGFGNQGLGQGSYGSGGYGVGGGSQYGGSVASGEYGGNNFGSSMYRMPPSSVGMPTGGAYPDGGNYGLSSSGYQAQQPPSGPRVPPAGMYQPPFY